MINNRVFCFLGCAECVVCRVEGAHRVWTIRGSGKWDLGDVERGLSGLSRRIEQALQEED